jgi:hypothetical protein
MLGFGIGMISGAGDHPTLTGAGASTAVGILMLLCCSVVLQHSRHRQGSNTADEHATSNMYLSVINTAVLHPWWVQLARM